MDLFKTTPRAFIGTRIRASLAFEQNSKIKIQLKSENFWIFSKLLLGFCLGSRFRGSLAYLQNPKIKIQRKLGEIMDLFQITHQACLKSELGFQLNLWKTLKPKLSKIREAIGSFETELKMGNVEKGKYIILLVYMEI